MAKTYIPILSYKNKKLNVLSHMGAYVAFIGLIVLGFTAVFAEVIPANIVKICMTAGIIAFLGGTVLIGIIWIVSKILARKAKKAERQDR